MTVSLSLSPTPSPSLSAIPSPSIDPLALGRYMGDCDTPLSAHFEAVEAEAESVSNRAERLRLLNVVADWSSNESLTGCQKALGCDPLVKVKVLADGTYKAGSCGQKTCQLIHLCPVCSRHERHNRAVEVEAETVALLLAGVIILPLKTPTLIMITLVAVGALAISIVISKKGSMSSELIKATAEQAEFDARKAAELGAPASAPSSKKRLTVDEPEDTTEDNTEA